MRKTMALTLVLSILLSMNVGFAMTNKDLETRRSQMYDSLKRTPEVTWDELSNNEKAYAGKVVKFRAKCTGRDDPAVMLQDSAGHKFIILRTSYYQLKLDTEYTISAKFKNIITPDGEEPGAIFTEEIAHLPFMSEYGL